MVTLNLVGEGWALGVPFLPPPALLSSSLSFLCSSLGGSGTMGVALMPGWLNSRASGASRSVPVEVSSTVEPMLPPAGETVLSRGLGSWLPSCGWAWAWPANSPAATASAAQHTRKATRGPRIGGYPPGQSGNGARNGGGSLWQVRLGSANVARQ